jgi:hypothetical protein
VCTNPASVYWSKRYLYIRGSLSGEVVRRSRSCADVLRGSGGAQTIRRGLETPAQTTRRCLQAPAQILCRGLKTPAPMICTALHGCSAWDSRSQHVLQESRDPCTSTAPPPCADVLQGSGNPASHDHAEDLQGSVEWWEVFHATRRSKPQSVRHVSYMSLAKPWFLNLWTTI